MTGIGGIGDAATRERKCKIYGDRFVTGYFEGREICLRCEQVAIEKDRASRVTK